LSGTFFIITRTERDMIKHVYWSYIKYLSFLADFNGTLNSSKDFRKTVKYQMSRKSFQREPRCSTLTNGWTDRRTDMTKLMGAFRNFANSNKTRVAKTYVCIQPTTEPLSCWQDLMIRFYPRKRITFLSVDVYSWNSVRLISC
jgi:hypothetical protein